MKEIETAKEAVRKYCLKPNVERISYQQDLDKSNDKIWMNNKEIRQWWHRGFTLVQKGQEVPAIYYNLCKSFHRFSNDIKYHLNFHFPLIYEN